MSININQAVEALSQSELSTYTGIQYDYLKGLNTQQQIAATAQEGNYLVIAGPGTGKTHTLAFRVVHLVKSGTDPKAIVVITFTRKAGNELKNRINHLLPNTALGFVGTFHAFSNHISSEIGSASPISKFRLLDQEDDVQVHKLVMADFKDFNKKIRPKALQKLISYCNNADLSVEAYINQFDMRDLRDDIQNITEYKTEYERYKSNHMLSNYDDMIILITRYLKKEGANKITAPYEYLMVDEYQDTNQMQLDFIKTLKIPNIMAIGDDFQGIYGFRGADHRIILNFYHDFPDAKMIKLVDNYRSVEEVVEKINQTVEASQLGYHKQLKPVRNGKGVAKVVSGESLDQHKQFIVNNIKAYEKETHALIYRYNKNRTVFEQALIKENIEYSVYGGIRLLERKHIKDVLAFLMTWLNRLDVVSFNRILTLLPGIGPKTSSRLIKTNLEHLDKLTGDKKTYLLKVKNILESDVDKVILFDNICTFYFGIFEHVESEFYTKEDIKNDFKMIRELLETYDSLHNFIINLILDPVVDMHKGKNPKVILTTIHSAKGLEFDHVYYFHTHDWYKNYDTEALEEDRRLFYVGISRAKNNLYIFDHSDFRRDFTNVLNDFSNGRSVVAEEMVSYEHNKSVEQTKEITDENSLKVSFMEKFKSIRDLFKK